jgi:acyl-CoA synthetase (AMP-forming)/AMP-acid ligase II
MDPHGNIHDLLRAAAEHSPGSPAILGLGRAPLTYGELAAHTETIIRALNAVGVGRGDRVAVALPNGPEMAVCALGVAAACTCAPLNPGYTPAELEFYLSDLQPRAVIVEAGADPPVVAVASVACTPGFHAPRFFDWLEHFRPTWYTAVPTMHHAIVARAARHAGIIQCARLRFIRSCSSALAPKLMAGLEAAFSAPVVEAYGMTEAAHQMAVNPLPPLPRKPGSVGRAAGCEIAIMSVAGALLPVGATGEIVVRGAKDLQQNNCSNLVRDQLCLWHGSGSSDSGEISISCPAF